MLRLLRDAEALSKPLGPPPPPPIAEDDAVSIAESVVSDASAQSEGGESGKAKVKTKGKGFGYKLAGAVKSAAAFTEEVPPELASVRLSSKRRN